MLTALFDILNEPRVKRREKNFLLFSLFLIGISAFMNIKTSLEQMIFFTVIFFVLNFITTKKIKKCIKFINLKMKTTPDNFLYYLYKRLYFYLVSPNLVFYPGLVLALMSFFVPALFNFSIVLLFLIGSVLCLKSLIIVNGYEDVLRKIYGYKK